MPDNGSVTIDINRNIGAITFHHPKGNALPGKLLQDLARTIADAGENGKVQVIVLKSRGVGAFCGGAFFNELASVSDPGKGKQFFMGFADVINAMRKCPRLIIVRVQGKTVGGGVGIASAGDYTLAHRSAAVKLSELTLGIGPFVVGPAVRRKIGDAAFNALAIDARNWRQAGWAERKGLYAGVFDTMEKLDGAVDSLASDLAISNPEAMNELKRVFWRGTDHWDTLLEQRAEISGRLALSEYTRKFIKEHNTQG